MTPDPDALLLVDVSHIYWREYFKSSMSEVGAFEVTLRGVESLCRMFPQTIVCQDSSPTWRHARTDHLPKELRYKANRKAKPEAAVQALADACERINDTLCPVVCAPGQEADDAIASLKTAAWDRRVVISTEDKDLAQLVDDSCSLWCRDGGRGPDDIRRIFGVNPSQMRDFLALWGDTADNIQGCPGIGQKKAAHLLSWFGSLDAILEVIREDESGDKKQALLELTGVEGIREKEARALIQWDHTLPVELVTLKTDLDLNPDAILNNWQSGPTFDF